MAEIENLKIGSGGTIHIVGNEDIVAEAWAAGQNYVKDKSYVINNHVLYVCNTSHTSTSPFDPTNWTQITVGKSLGDMLSAIPASASDLPYAAGVSTADAIGVLSNLDTSTQTSLVAAINELIATSKLNPVYGNEASGSIATFDTSLALPLQDCTIAINAVQESGTPPKAISGFTGANIKVVGNLLNGNKVAVGEKTVRLGELASNTYSTYLLATTYTLSFVRTTSKTFRVDLIDSDGTVTNILPSSNPQNNVTFTVAKEGYYCFSIYLYGGVVPSDIDNVMLVGGSEVKPYKAYTAPTTTAITWQDEAGTVYGGSLRIANGYTKLVDNGNDIDLGTLTWTKNTSFANTLFVANITGKKTNNSNCLCTHYANGGIATGATFLNNLANNNFASDTSNGIYIRDDSKSSLSADDFKTAMSGVYLVYELATPQTYQLTPNSTISAIVGTNNIFMDTNGNTSVVYACSLKDYIDG